jgi:hypothetical protein
MHCEVILGSGVLRGIRLGIHDSNGPISPIVAPSGHLSPLVFPQRRRVDRQGLQPDAARQFLVENRGDDVWREQGQVDEEDWEKKTGTPTTASDNGPSTEELPLFVCAISRV